MSDKIAISICVNIKYSTNSNQKFNRFFWLALADLTSVSIITSFYHSFYQILIILVYQFHMENQLWFKKYTDCTLVVLCSGSLIHPLEPSGSSWTLFKNKFSLKKYRYTPYVSFSHQNCYNSLPQLSQYEKSIWCFDDPLIWCLLQKWISTGL